MTSLTECIDEDNINFQGIHGYHDEGINDRFTMYYHSAFVRKLNLILLRIEKVKRPKRE